MKTPSWILNYKFWIDLLMPNRCPICGKVIVWNELICQKCEKQLPFLDKPFNAEEKIRSNSMDKLCAVFEYKGNAVKGIYNLKTKKGLNFAEYATEYICEYFSEDDVDFDFVTYVPMSNAKRILRGYNQAERIAGFAAKRLGKPLIKDLLIHKSDSFEQHTLNYDERQKNAELIFKINPDHSDICGKRLLLCDDVVTTGATINICAELLKSMGAEDVCGAAICSTSLRDFVPKEYKGENRR